MVKYTYIVAYALLLAIGFSSCSKEVAIEKVVAKAAAVDPTLVSNIDAGRTEPYDGPYYREYSRVGEPVYFAKFNFRKNQEVMGDDWDIAFSKTTIIVNGGSKIDEESSTEPTRTGNGALCFLRKPFDVISARDINEACFRQDSPFRPALPAGSDNGWYHYTFMSGNKDNHHLIYPLAGRTLLIKTHDGGGYVKMEILSYYKNSEQPSQNMSKARYYTFQYVYVPVND